jgi:hypothetical protein
MGVISMWAAAEISRTMMCPLTINPILLGPFRSLWCTRRRLARGAGFCMVLPRCGD